MRIAIVEWWPRICGAVTWALHLSHARPPRGVTVDRLTFSSSGRPLAAWDRPELWQAHRIRDAVDVLDSYDLVILSDIVCCAPATTKDPYYVDILNRTKTPWTAMVHDGAYGSKHDETFRAVLASPSFSDALITTRLREARARVDPFAARPILWLARPYLPYSFDYQPAPATPPLRQRAAHGILMTSRIAVNKGQNVAMYLAPRIDADVHLFGYNAWGCPSIGWRLWELAVALKYKPVRGFAPPKVSRGMRMTNPRMNKFNTGVFAVIAGANRIEYHDGFDGLEDVDWSLGRVHLSLSNTSVRGTLEYVTLEAIAAGAVAVVPAHAIEYAKYAAGAFPTVPYTRAIISGREDGTLQPLKADAFELDETVKVLAELTHYTPIGKLERIAAAQRRELEEKHDPAVILKALIHHAGGSHGSRRANLVRPAPGRRDPSVREAVPGDRSGADDRPRPAQLFQTEGAGSHACDGRQRLGLLRRGRRHRPERQSNNQGGRMKKRGKLKAIGANIFAGGFTVGVAKHFDIVAHLEHDDYGVEVARANFPELQIFIGTDTWPEKLPPGKELDFIYSNPPCAIWSLAANRDGRVDWRKDPRLQRIRDIHALIARYRPAVWVWESVCQAFERGREFVESLADAAAALGYSASYVLVDAMYLRAPQTRKRFFLVLHRIAIDWKAATPDFAATPVTVGDALKGVKPNQFTSRISDTPIGKQLRLLIAATPPGGRLAGTFEKGFKAIKGESATGKIYGKPSFLAYRIDPTKTAGVVFGDKTFHHKEIRHLALNELGAIHGFPKDYDWVGEHHRLDVQRGVLPPVAEWLAGAVARAVRAGIALRKPTRTLVDFRRPPGYVQDVLALPAGVDLDWRPGESPDAAADRRGPAIPDKISGSSRSRGGPRPPADREGVRKAAKAGTGAPSTGARASKGARRASAAGAGVGKDPSNRPASRGAERDRTAGRPARTPWTDPATGAALTSGEFIRARLLERRLTDEAIVELVLARFAGRRTTTHDVAWNRRKIALDGGPKLERIVR